VAPRNDGVGASSGFVVREVALQIDEHFAQGCDLALQPRNTVDEFMVGGGRSGAYLSAFNEGNAGVLPITPLHLCAQRLSFCGM